MKENITFKVIKQLFVLVGILAFGTGHTFSEQDLKPGTVWHYQTRPGEEYSRVHIGYTYRSRELGQVVYYILIEHREIYGAYPGKGLDVAVTKSVLLNSLTELIPGESATDISDGFEDWKEDHRNEGVMPYGYQVYYDEQYTEPDTISAILSVRE